jgi:hypothetical protein
MYRRYEAALTAEWYGPTAIAVGLCLWEHVEDHD